MSKDYTEALSDLKKAIEKHITHAKVKEEDFAHIEKHVVEITRILFDNELKETAKERAQEALQLKKFKHLASDNVKARNRREAQEAMKQNTEIRMEEKANNAIDQQVREGFDADQQVRDQTASDNQKAWGDAQMKAGSEHV